MFGSSILDWNFYCSFAKPLKVYYVACSFENGNFMVLKYIEYFSINV